MTTASGPRAPQSDGAAGRTDLKFGDDLVKRNSKESLPLPGSLLFFLMLVVPTTYQSIKLALLLVCLLGTVTSSRFSISARGAVGILGVAALGAIEVGYGFIRGTPGASTQWTVFILWPLVFYVLSTQICTVARLTSLFRVMVAAAWVIGLYGLIMVLAMSGTIPRALYYSGIDAGQGTYFDNGVIAFSLYSLSSVLFLLPALLALAITWPRATPPPTPWWALVGAICILVLLVLMSGRRGLFIVLIGFPVILLLLLVVLRAPGIRRTAAAMIAAALVAWAGARLIGFDLARVAQYLTTGDIKVESSAIRLQQFHQLVDAWRSDNIFLGSGLGAVAPGPLRSFDTPWAYELSYVALLFQIGIVGLAFYGTIIIYTYVHVVTAALAHPKIRPWAIAVFMGGVSFLVANATNPYLLKFDYMWILFLPVAVHRIAVKAVASGDAKDPRTSGGKRVEESSATRN